MPRLSTVWLAGPHRFNPAAEALGLAQRRLCAAAGFEPLGLEARGDEAPERGELRARELYADAMAGLRVADALVADCTPFRGPGPDAGAAFEAGVAAGLGKPVCAYMNVASEAEAELCGRVESWIGAQADPAGGWCDAEGWRIEDLGLPETALLWAEARRFFVIVTSEPETELAGLELCLDALKLYAD
ncbi:MAG: nucleoside 2-deoxyribosyltransferase [Caulobacteraceae bacterium]|nr:nucleoside 2-deoxyribosyltransferase [Caulobacter sp.]